MEIGIRYKLFNLVADELERAEKKHPVFCYKLCDEDMHDWGNIESVYKNINEGLRGFSADNILIEEIAEAMNAYLHPYTEFDKEHCLQELAQCGAVIIRMMEYVEVNK